jgi:hypothetical protein
MQMRQLRLRKEGQLMVKAMGKKYKYEPETPATKRTTAMMMKESPSSNNKKAALKDKTKPLPNRGQK